MITTLSNGIKYIRLGEGTVFIGNVRAEGFDKPVGIGFSNEKGVKNAEGSVVIELASNEAIASYMMALVRFLEEYADDEESEFNKSLFSLKGDLEKMLPDWGKNK